MNVIKSVSFATDGFKAGDVLEVKMELDDALTSIAWLVAQVHGQISFANLEDIHDIVHPSSQIKLSFTSQYQPIERRLAEGSGLLYVSDPQVLSS